MTTWTPRDTFPPHRRWVMLRWSHSVEDGKRVGFYSRRAGGYHVTFEGEQLADQCHPTHWRELTRDELMEFRALCKQCSKHHREPASELCEWCESQEAKIKWE